MVSCVQLFVTPRTAAHQAPLSMGFPRQEYCSACHFSLQGIFLTQGSNPCLWYFLHWQASSLPLSHPGSPASVAVIVNKVIERKVRFFLQCYIWECKPKPARVGEKNNEAGKAGKPQRRMISTLATVCHAPDTARLLTDRVEKLRLEGRMKRREQICHLLSPSPPPVGRSLTPRP